LQGQRALVASGGSDNGFGDVHSVTSIRIE